MYKAGGINMDKQNKISSFLTFKLGDETFAANVSNVLNILEMTKITKVPKAPDYMKGVINLRGSVLPLIDTRIKFGMSETEITTNTCILVLDINLDGESVHVGALVDSVQEVLEINESEVQPPPSIGNKYRSEFIDGMVKADDEFVMILNMLEILSTEDIIDMKEMTDQARQKSENKEAETVNEKSEE
jgi:purine-binding chemotaxis protein CheW